MCSLVAVSGGGKHGWIPTLFPGPDFALDSYPSPVDQSINRHFSPIFFFILKVIEKGPFTFNFDLKNYDIPTLDDSAPGI